MKFEDIKKLHQKKFREKLRYLHHRRRAPRAGAGEGRGARCATARRARSIVTRDYAHWSSALPMHVIQSKHMAQISETRSPQGIAAVVPLLEPRRAAAGRARGLSSRDPGSRQSRHHPAHAGVVRKFPLPAAAPTAWTCTTARWCAPAWARSSTCPSSSMCRWTRCPNDFARIACLDLNGRARCVAGVPGIRLLRLRQRSARPAARTDERRSAQSRSRFRNRRDRVAERGGDGEHLPVRAQSATRHLGHRPGALGLANPLEPRPQVRHLGLAQPVRHRIGVPFDRIARGSPAAGAIRRRAGRARPDPACHAP